MRIESVSKTPGGIMQVLWQDLRYGARMLLKRPGFALIAVVTLALGIGANTAIFSLVNTLLWRPLPVKDAHQLAGVYGRREGLLSEEEFSYADYVDYRDRNTVFSGLAAYSSSWVWLTEGERSTELFGRLVSANFFPMLGVRPPLGRFFLPEEDQVPGAKPVVVIGHRLWTRHFNSDPGVIGKTIRMNRLGFTVIGVAPLEVRGVFAGDDVELWMPLMMAGMANPPRNQFTRERDWLSLIGRLKPGRTIEEAQAELATVARQLETDYPATNRDLKVYIEALRGMNALERDARTKAPALLAAAVACVLLIACANLAGLLLARSTARRKEIAIRLSLGAGRWRLVRQLLTESLLLAFAGGTAGLLLAVWAEDWIKLFYSYGMSGLVLDLDWLTLGYTCALSIATGVVVGLAPALQATRPDLVSSLKDQGQTSGYRRSWFRPALVVTQVALSLMLLVGAGLLLRSLRNVINDPGFDARNIAHFRLRPGRLGYDVERARTYHREVLRRVEAIPGVQSAVLLAWGTPARGGGNTVSIALPSQSPVQPDHRRRISTHEITPRYFATLRIPLLEGREFDESDSERAPLVAIVNETLSRQLWPTGNALGQSLMIDGREHSVVGVVKDAQPHTIVQPVEPFVFLAYWQRQLTDSRLLVRVAGDPDLFLPALRNEVVAVDPDVHIGQEMSLEDRNWLTFQTEHLMGNALTGAGVIALILSAIGLYGLLGYAVSQRSREIGVRMALGAQRIDILRLVVGQGLRLTILGIVFGLAAAIVLSSTLASFLYGITRVDLISFVGSSMTLTLVALLACYLPARRATKVDPMAVLKQE